MGLFARGFVQKAAVCLHLDGSVAVKSGAKGGGHRREGRPAHRQQRESNMRLAMVVAMVAMAGTMFPATLFARIKSTGGRP